jgi:hypothetical protein
MVNLGLDRLGQPGQEKGLKNLDDAFLGASRGTSAKFSTTWTLSPHLWNRL